MEFTISIEKAKVALEASSVVLSANAKLQEILQNYLIQASDNKVLIIGTDLEIAMLAYQECDVKEPGMILVDGKKLSNIIRYASGDTLLFKSEEGKLVIKSQTGKWVLMTREPDDFPKVDNFDPSKEFKYCNRQQFIQALSRVAHSVCEDETRRILNAVFIDDSRFISTDGKMVTIFNSPVNFSLKEVLIPQRSLQPLMRVIDKFSTENFQFQDSKAFYYFKLGENVFSVRKVNIQFPSEKTLSTVEATKNKNNIFVKVNRPSLISAIERVRLNASQDSKAIFLQATERGITLKALDEFGNYSVENIPAVLEDKNEKISKIEVFFNWVNLFESLKAMTSDSISLQFNEKYARSPLFIGEISVDSILLPVELAFNQEELK